MIDVQLPPEDAFTDNDARTMLALLVGARGTVRDVADAAGVAQTTAYESLRWLRYHGLVTWEDDKSATIRPTCSVATFHVTARTLDRPVRGRAARAALGLPRHVRRRQT